MKHDWATNKPKYSIRFQGNRMTVPKLAKKLGLKPVTIYRRLRLGMNPILPRQQGRPIEKLYNGRTLHDWGRRLHMNPQTIRTRIRAGMGDRAFTRGRLVPQRERTGRRFVCNKKRLTMIEWAEELGLTRQRIYQLIHEYGAAVGLDPVRRETEIGKRRRRRRARRATR